MKHVITVVPVVKPKLDWHGPAYVAICSCGRYQSAPCGFPGRAESAGQHHADAKNAQEQETAL